MRWFLRRIDQYVSRRIRDIYYQVATNVLHFSKKKESAKHKDCKRMLHSFIDVVKIRVFMIKSKLIPFVLQVLVALIELIDLCTEKDCSRLANEYLSTKLYSP